MQSHDMDMCFIAHGILFHCATNGSLIPMALRDIRTFNSVKYLIRNSIPIYGRDDLDFNNRHVDEVVRRQRAIMEQYNNAENSIQEDFSIQMSDEFIRENYIRSFVEMAIRGAHSYDHHSTHRISDKVVIESYVLVSKPKSEIKHSLMFRNHKEVDIRIPDISDLVDISDNSIVITVEYS